MEYFNITNNDIRKLAEIYVETFNSEPWNDKWTLETAEKRLHQLIDVEDFYGIYACDNGKLCGMILGSEEQYYDGIMFNIKEFCVRNGLRGQGIGSEIFQEFLCRLKDKGIKDIILFTAKGDYTEHFYHKHGLDSYSKLTLMGKEL